MTQKANILLLHGQKDTAHLDELQDQLGILAGANDLNFALNNCVDCYENVDNCLLLTQKISQAHIVVFIISKYSLKEFNEQALKVVKDNLYKSADSQTTILIGAVVDDAKIEYLSEFKGRHIIENQPDIYNKIVKTIIDVRLKLTNRYAFAEPLSTGLLDINYKDQRRFLQTHIDKNCLNFLNVILMQGTEKCGHQLFMKSVFKSHSIKIEDEQTQLLKFNVRNFEDFKDIKWVWHTIAQQVYNHKNPPTRNSKDIANYLYDRLQREHIVMIINDIDSSRADILMAVQKIWLEIYTHINHTIISLNKPLPHHLFLFLNDRSGREFDKAHFKGDVEEAIYEKVMCVLPKIKYLSIADAEQWLEWVVNKQDNFKDCRKYLSIHSLIPEEQTEVPMKAAVENVFNALIDVDDSLKHHKHKHLADWFPDY